MIEYQGKYGKVTILPQKNPTTKEDKEEFLTMIVDMIIENKILKNQANETPNE